jgi:hypothetical protein
MFGNDQVRFCEHCHLHVTNLSTMTRTEAMRFVERSRGRICIRYVENPSGGPLAGKMPGSFTVSAVVPRESRQGPSRRR